MSIFHQQIANPSLQQGRDVELPGAGHCYFGDIRRANARRALTVGLCGTGEDRFGLGHGHHSDGREHVLTEVGGMHAGDRGCVGREHRHPVIRCAAMLATSAVREEKA